MAKIKMDRNAFECPIKIQLQAFDALFITRATWHHLVGLSVI